MKILLINNGFCDSKVHSNLAKEVDKHGLTQTVYCPVREESHIGKFQFEGFNINFVYSFCIKSWYKFAYHYKIWKLYRDMKSKIDLSRYDIVHAPQLFSDGGLALKMYKDYGVPYVTTVRNTDLNSYIRLLKHTYPVGREILLNANKIYFISAGIKKQFEESKFVKPILERVKDKFVLQPNGVEDYWLKHITHAKRGGHNILYIGDFSDNKNVCRLGDAVIQLREYHGFEDVKLIIVGGGKEDSDATRRMIESHPECMEYLGKIYEKEKLCEVMRSCAIFAMPSIYETFGLVYIEALSQNLPVLYTKGQGIDGMFDSTIGVSVNPRSVNEIRNALKELFTNHDKYGNQHVDFSMFDWKKISQRYVDDYKSVIAKM